MHDFVEIWFNFGALWIYGDGLVINDRRNRRPYVAMYRKLPTFLVFNYFEYIRTIWELCVRRALKTGGHLHTADSDWLM